VANASHGADEKIANQADTMKFIQMMHAENSRNIGKTLPIGIEVLDRNGQSVDLHTKLKGPVTVVKIDPNCTPCQDILGYVSHHAKEYSQTEGASIAILITQNVGNTKLKNTRGAFDLYSTASSLDDSFFAGKITPTVFFFDKNLKLVSRRAGLTTPQEMLQYPEAH
jgi:hypothetical protein